MIRRIFILLLIAIFAGGNCPISKDPVQFTEADSGKTVQLKVGTCLNISLEGNPSTGYMWYAGTKIPPVLKQVKQPLFKPKSKLIGSPGILVFQFTAVRPGKGTLKLIYHRSWEKKIPPARTFVLNITVID